MSNIDFSGRVASWQRGDSRKRGNPPEPMKWPKEGRQAAVASREDQEAQKKRTREELVRRQRLAKEAGLKSEVILYGERKAVS